MIVCLVAELHFDWNRHSKSFACSCNPHQCNIPHHALPSKVRDIISLKHRDDTFLAPKKCMTYKANIFLTVWDVRPDTLVSGLKVVLTTQILFSAATTLTKLSMLVLVYRIVTESSKKLPKIIIGVMALIALEGVAFILGVMFQCG